MTKPELKLYLAAPRGFCAGVDRAIKIVEMALQKWGAPVFVRHEIVHNKTVVDGLAAKGAIFVDESVPSESEAFTEINALWFKDRPAARKKVDAFNKGEVTAT